MISPSAIALHAAGLDPVCEYILKEKAHCVMCGILMQAGDEAAAWAPTNSFTNWAHLLAPESKHVCSCCAGAWRSEFTQGWATGAVYAADGVHKTNSADTLAFTLLYPPQTPFLWVRGDQKQQHLVWRTPVTVDANLLMIRLGERVVAIRRQLVIDTFQMMRNAEEALKTIPKEKRPVKIANPGNEAGLFKYLDWGIDNVDHGLLSDALLGLAAAEDDHAAEDSTMNFAVLRDRLQLLNYGETWALMILLKSKNPAKPEIVATPKPV